MICPECKQSFEGDGGFCPRCGRLRGVVKTSTILISSGGTRKVYRSVEDVPDLLKKRLLWSTNGLNSATIVIADREGRKEIAKAIRSLPAAMKPEAPRAVESPAPGLLRARLSHLAVRSVALLILAAAIALVWFLFR